MDISDILYTPLDIPSFPAFDSTKVRQWIIDHPNQNVHHKADASKLLGPLYPWNIAYAKQLGKWLDGFDETFPELSKFFSDCFGLEENQISSICMLPLRSDFLGTGFWHSDQDEQGLRMYLDNSDPDSSSVLIKPMTRKFTSRAEVGILPRDCVCDKVQQDVVYEVKTPAGQSANFLNNMSCVHAVKSNKKDQTRIAVVMGMTQPYKSVPVLNDLILRSAEKFKDRALFWTPPK